MSRDVADVFVRCSAESDVDPNLVRGIDDMD